MWVLGVGNVTLLKRVQSLSHASSPLKSAQVVLCDVQLPVLKFMRGPSSKCCLGA